ncbi:hypothetical protein D3C80_734670 [compost metagenome]
MVIGVTPLFETVSFAAVSTVVACAAVLVLSTFVVACAVLGSVTAGATVASAVFGVPVAEMVNSTSSGGKHCWSLQTMYSNLPLIFAEGTFSLIFCSKTALPSK